MVEMIKKKTFWITMIIICLVIIGGYTKFFKEDDNLFVTAEEVVKRDVIHKVNASGIIQPEEEVQITSMVSGWITEITVIEGDTVKPGQHLISIDKKQYQAAYDQALSQVKSSKANLKNVTSQLERTKQLFEQKLISKQEIEQIEASYELALSQVDQANAALLSREDELSKTKLVAPKHGIVTSLTKEEGEMALGGMFNPGVLMTIADLSFMEVLVDVNENDVVNIAIGDTTEIEIDAYPDTLFFGIVSEIAHTAQSMNMGSQQQVTNFKVKVRMITVPDRIRPGMSSTVNIITETIKDALSIPIQALTSRSDDYNDFYKEIIKVGIHKVSSIKVAEASKAIENAQRDINIAFVNEVMMLSKALNINSNEVLEAAKTKWNFLDFKPGLVGGHCLPVDPYYFSYIFHHHST